MNIDHVNNPINPKRQAARTETQQRVRTERPADVDTAAAAPAQTPASDSVDIDIRSPRVEELTDTAARLEQEPRTDLVERIRARVRDGEYNTPETIRRVAQSLLSNDILAD